MTTTDIIENELKFKSKECLKLAWCHAKQGESYNNSYNLLFYINYGLLGLNSASTIVVNSFKNIDPDTVNIINTVFGAIGALTGIITALIKQLEYNTIANNHKAASVNYNKLHGDYIKFLALDTELKKNLTENFEYLELQFTNLIANSPSIAIKTFDEYEKKNINSGRIMVLVPTHQQGTLGQPESSKKEPETVNQETVSQENIELEINKTTKNISLDDDIFVKPLRRYDNESSSSKSDDIEDKKEKSKKILDEFRAKRFFS